MKIVHVAECFAGGVFDFIHTLVQELPEFRHAVIYGIREDTPQAFEDQFPQATLFYHWQHTAREISPVRDLKALFHLTALLRPCNDADIVHLHSSKAGFLGRLACRILGMQEKVLYSPNGAAFLRNDISGTKVNIYKLLEKTAAGLGGRVVCSCPSETGAFLGIGIPALCINNGVNCAGPMPSKYPSDVLTVGTAGRTTAQKDPALFNAIATRYAKNQNISFLWIGDGELRGLLTSPNIRVTGWLSKTDFKKEIGSIDIYLSTSRWEGLPLSTLHVMCAGKALLLHDCVGNRDLVKDGINGFLFRREDEAIQRIQEFSQDPGKLASMGKSSRDIVLKDFSLQRMTNQYKALYMEK